MRILELGSYVAPAYAGMILAEQGHQVVKLVSGSDPTLTLKRGSELWDWLCEGKILREQRYESLAEDPTFLRFFDGVIDNVRAQTWAKLGIDPSELAQRFDLRWVSLRPDVGERSFDIIAQARAWMRFAPYVPFYIGDTAAGLWLAFKLLAMRAPGHAVVRQATALAKLVEGELIIDEPRESERVPWDVEQYGYDREANAVRVTFKGQEIVEPVRDRAWQLEHLRHVRGRLVI